MSAKFTELIKNFNKIRDYMRDFYIYGYKTRSDFQYKSLRTYDNERRRIESWLGAFIRFDTSKKGKQISISCDSGQLSENPLYQAYRTKSFTDNDIMLHFMLLDLLADGDAMTLEEIADRLCTDYGQYFEPQTIRLKLKEYVGEGLLTAARDGRDLRYRKLSVTPETLCPDRQDFFDLVRFYTEAAPFGAVGSHILREFGAENDLFLMKHHFIVHTLADDILLTLTGAITDERIVIVKNYGKRKQETTLRVVPLEILVSTQSGRQYVMCYLPAFRRFNALRLDYIQSATPVEVCPTYARHAEAYRRNRPLCWGTCFGNGRNAQGQDTLRLTLHIDEQTEGYVLQRLMRERRSGSVTRVGENTFLYEITLFDVSEAAPWLKSFIGRIADFSCTNAPVSARFYRDIQRLHRMYADDPPAQCDARKEEG